MKLSRFDFELRFGVKSYNDFLKNEHGNKTYQGIEDEHEFDAFDR
jgi:hypothetical protein